MSAITFDTLAYSKTLQAAGMPPEQADAFAIAQKTALDEMVATKELATKELATKELATKELATKADILMLDNKIEATKHEILKWTMGMLVAQTALIVAVIAFIK